MRRPIAAMIALLATCWSFGSQADECPCRPHVVRHHVTVHRVFHRHVIVANYGTCPVALANVIRQGCNSYYRSYFNDVP